MILDIVKKPNAVLKQQARLIEPNDIPNYAALITDMFDTLEQSGGVGLAAPQVGRDISLFVVNVDGNTHTFINPVVIDASTDIAVQPEGCLSLPGLILDIPRSKKIKAMYRDASGVQHVNDFDEGWSRIFLHEFDHLQGIMIDDRVGPVTLMMAKKKAAKIARLSAITKPKRKR
jgi:peptide deformylase